LGIFTSLGLKDSVLEINSLGKEECQIALQPDTAGLFNVKKISALRQLQRKFAGTGC